MKVFGLLRLYAAHEVGGYHFVVFNALALPLMLAYLGTRILQPGDALLQWLAGCIVYGISVNGFAQIGFGALHDRFFGRLQLLRGCGVSTADYYFVQCVLAVVQGVVVAWLGVAAFVLFGFMRPESLGVGVMTFAAAVVASAIAGIGLFAIFISPSFDAGNIAIGLASVGLGLLSPVFFDLAAAPSLVRPLLALSPLGQAVPMVEAGMMQSPVSSAGGALAALLSGVYLILGYWALCRCVRVDAP